MQDSHSMSASSSSSNYIFREGKFVGDFERLYREVTDPWFQSHDKQVYDSRRQIALRWSVSLCEQHKLTRVLEVGCGFGHLTTKLKDSGLDAIGLDIAPTAIKKARELYPSGNFIVGDCSDFALIESLRPDIIIFSEISWYILPTLREFLVFLQKYARSQSNKIFLIHLLSIYNPGEQRHGLDFFVDLPGILKFFNLNFLEYGQISSDKGNGTMSSGTFFIAEV